MTTGGHSPQVLVAARARKIARQQQQNRSGNPSTKEEDELALNLKGSATASNIKPSAFAASKPRDQLRNHGTTTKTALAYTQDNKLGSTPVYADSSTPGLTAQAGSSAKAAGGKGLSKGNFVVRKKRDQGEGKSVTAPAEPCKLALELLPMSLAYSCFVPLPLLSSTFPCFYLSVSPPSSRRIVVQALSSPKR